MLTPSLRHLRPVIPPTPSELPLPDVEPPWSFASFRTLAPRSRRVPWAAQRAATPALPRGQKVRRRAARRKKAAAKGGSDEIATLGALQKAQSGGKWDLAVDLMRRLREGGVQLDAKLYDATVVASAASSWQAALSVLDDMSAVDLEPGLDSGNAVLAALEEARQWQLALRLLQQMSSVGLRIDGLSWDEAAEVAQALKERLGIEEDDGEDESADAEEGEEEEDEEAGEEQDANSSQPPRVPALTGGEPEPPARKVRGGIQDTLGATATSPAATRLVDTTDPIKAAINLKRELLRKIGPPSLSRRSASRDGPYAKELCLLEHVLDTARAGDPFSVTQAIENYGEGVLGSTSQWLKVAGGAKKIVLKAGVCGAPPGTSVLEIGAYVGYSAIRMSVLLTGVRIISLEVDPVHVVVARNVIALAGRAGKCDVWTGHSKDLLHRISNRYGGPGELLMSAVFMDQKGSRYTEDLDGLERENLIIPGSVVIADNVLKPGAPTFLWHTLIGPTYETQILRVGEFAMPSEDWISISVMRTRSAPKRAKGPIWMEEELAKQAKADAEPDVPRPWLDNAPEKLPELEREADRVRTRARRPGRSVTFEEWAEFAQDMVKSLGVHGIYATGAAPVEVAMGSRTRGWQRAAKNRAARLR